MTTRAGYTGWARAVGRHIAAICVAALTLMTTLPADAGRFKQDWQVTGFWGKTSTNQTWGQMITELDIGIHSDSGLAGVGVSKRMWTVWDHLDIELEAQAVRHYRAQSHWEFVGQIIARWTRFPWDSYVDTTIAIGDGISYATEVPALELQAHGPDESTQTLNYLFGEITLRPPGTESWALALRFHHRSGVFRLIDNVTEGSGSFLLALKIGL